MATYTKALLSGSTNGKQIKVTQTASAGDTVHTTGTSATILDEVTLYANNTDTTDRKLTIQWGGTTSPDDLLELTIPAESGDVLVRTGVPLSGTGAASNVVRAFAATANVVMITGYVNRYTP